jgi:hypothetical protein
MLRGRRFVAEITKHKDRSVYVVLGYQEHNGGRILHSMSHHLYDNVKKHEQCMVKRRTEKTFCAARYQCKYKSSPRILCTEWLKSTLDIFVRARKEAILEQAHHSGFTWSWNDVTVRGGGKSRFVYVPLLWDISEQAAQGVFKVSSNLRSVPRTFAAFGRILSQQYD